MKTITAIYPYESIISPDITSSRTTKDLSDSESDLHELKCCDILLSDDVSSHRVNFC